MCGAFASQARRCHELIICLNHPILPVSCSSLGALVYTFLIMRLWHFTGVGYRVFILLSCFGLHLELKMEALYSFETYFFLTTERYNKGSRLHEKFNFNRVL
jgi:hypothetical protein